MAGLWLSSQAEWGRSEIVPFLGGVFGGGCWSPSQGRLERYLYAGNVLRPVFALTLICRSLKTGICGCALRFTLTFAAPGCPWHASGQTTCAGQTASPPSSLPN